MPDIIPTIPTIIHPKNGWAFEVHPINPSTEPSFNPANEAPFRLIRSNGKGKQKRKEFHLIRNRRNPNLCFLIAKENPFDSKSSLSLWFKVGDTTVTPY